MKSTALVPGETVTLRGSRIMASCATGVSNLCSSNYSSVTTVVAQSPSNPISPSVVLSVPSVLSTCSNLTLDATLSYGSAGRPWTNVSWTVTSSSPTAALNALLATYSSIYSPLIISSIYLNRTSYTFKLSLTNYLGKTAVSAVLVKVSTGSGTLYSPIVRLSGPNYRTTYRSQAFSALAIATLPACSSTQSIRFSWARRCV